LSYQVGNDTYVLKLIYLPDMSKSMALKITPSILGSVSAQPQLQDGWMLTSLQASADNSKAIESFTTLARALIGGGGSAVAGSGDKSITALRERTQVAAAEDVLPPGLYE